MVRSALPYLVAIGLGSSIHPALAAGRAVEIVGVAGSATADALLVGAGGELYKRSGTAWRRTSEGGTAATLVRARGGSPTDIWAIGANTPSYHYDGKTWAVVKLGISGPGLLSRAGTPAVAVGRRVYVQVLGKWQILPALPAASGPAAPAPAPIIDVWANGPKDAIALSENGELRRLVGSTWQPIRHGLPQGEAPRRLLAGPAGQVFAVGDGGTLIRVERLAARKFGRAPQVPAGTRWLFSSVAQNKLWLVGEEGDKLVLGRVDGLQVTLVDTAAAPAEGDDLAAMLVAADGSVLVATKKGIVYARGPAGPFTQERVDATAPTPAPHPQNPPAVQGSGP